MPDALEQYAREIALIECERKKANEEGVPALQRLIVIAEGDTGQCRTVAQLLLSLYNSSRFPMPMAELRGLDWQIYQDCLAVMKMDYFCEREIHEYFPNGGSRFEALAETWRLIDFHRLYVTAVRAGVDI